MNGRTVAIAAFLAAIVLLTASLFLVWQGDKSVDPVKVYEVPDSIQPQLDTTVVAVPKLGIAEAKPTGASIESTHDNISWQERELLLRERAELKQKIAEKQKIIEANDAEIARLKARRAQQKQLVNEAESLRNWIVEEWVPETAVLVEEVGFLVLLVEAGLTEQDFMDMFPDLEERAYYAERLVALNEAREKVVAKIASASEPVRNEMIKALRNVSNSVLTPEDIDALIADIRAQS